MPTGYTAPLLSGETDFEGFCYNAIRAFSSRFRDSDQFFTPPNLEEMKEVDDGSGYDNNKIEELKDEYDKLRQMTDAELLAEFEKEKRRTVESLEEMVVTAKRNREILDEAMSKAMLLSSKNIGSEGFKEFVISQLKSTILQDGDVEYYERRLKEEMDEQFDSNEKPRRLIQIVDSIERHKARIEKRKNSYSENEFLSRVIAEVQRVSGK